MSSDGHRGLSTNEAARLLAADGPNALPGSRERRLLAIAADVLTEPMLLLLMAAASIYFVLGDAGEAMAIAASMLIVVGISIVQERRTERALARLRDLSSPRALVIRDGKEQRIAGHDVVRGDVVIIHEGDRVPADAVLVSATELSVDESILTGESPPVDKAAGHDDSQQPERQRVYFGSLVVVGGSSTVAASVLYVPALAAAFRFSAPPVFTMLIVVCGAIAAVVGTGLLARHKIDKWQPVRAGS